MSIKTNHPNMVVEGVFGYWILGYGEKMSLIDVGNPTKLKYSKLN